MASRQKLKITNYFDPETFAMIDAICEQIGVSRNLFITAAVYQAIIDYALRKEDLAAKTNFQINVLRNIDTIATSSYDDLEDGILTEGEKKKIITPNNRDLTREYMRQIEENNSVFIRDLKTAIFKNITMNLTEKNVKLKNRSKMTDLYRKLKKQYQEKI
jgi:hypothetical protein